MSQIELPFEGPFTVSDVPALWTPREIWMRLTAQMMRHFAESRRIDYKGGGKVDFTDMAKYLSAFSNTPDGGVLVFGADCDGNLLAVMLCQSTIKTGLRRATYHFARRPSQSSAALRSL